MGHWPADAQLAVSLVVNVEEGAEQSPRDGDRGPEPVDEVGVMLRHAVRNLANESNYPYGIKARGPRVLALLARHGVRATFTAAAVAPRARARPGPPIVAGGHEICAHGTARCTSSGWPRTRSASSSDRASARLDCHPPGDRGALGGAPPAPGVTGAITQAT